MMYRYQKSRTYRIPDDYPTVRAAIDASVRDFDRPFWVRHPHVMGAATFIMIVAAGLLLSGCECGRLWPCPGGFG